MSVRFYLIPWGPHSTQPHLKIPSYIGGHPSLPTPEFGGRCVLINRGIDGHCVAAVDLDDPAHALLAAKADVTQLPANLDATLSTANVTAAQAALEARKIPGDWIVVGMTWRRVLRNVLRMFLFFQLAHSRGLVQKATGAGITLATEFGDLPTNVQTRLQDAAMVRSYATIPDAMTVRNMLKRLIVDWTHGPIKLGGEEF